MFYLNIGISVFAFIFFFAFYFHKFGFKKVALYWEILGFAFGLTCAASAILIQVFLDYFQWRVLPESHSAAFWEETLKFAAWMMMHRRPAEDFHPTHGIFRFIMISLSFSFVENIFYSYGYSGPVVLFRIYSTVPMHIIAGIIAGYNVTLGKMSREPKRQYFFYCIGLSAAILFHMVFNALLSGGFAGLTFISLWIIAGFLYSSVLIEKTKNGQCRNVLELMKMDLVDYYILQRASKYEKFLFSRDKNKSAIIYHPVHESEFAQKILALVLIVSTGVLFVVEKFGFVNTLKLSERDFFISQILMGELTLAIMFMVFAANRRPFMAIREFFLQSPVSRLLPFKFGVHEYETYILDSYFAGFFLIELDWIKPNHVIFIQNPFFKSGKVGMHGVVKWVNQSSPYYPRGAIVEFDVFSPAYFLYLFSYHLQIHWMRCLRVKNLLKGAS